MLSSYCSLTTNFIRTDRGINKPEDLRGRKVAAPGFSSTSLRGIVQHEYGVKPEEIQWVISSKDSSAKAAGKVSKQESVIPQGLSVSKGPAGKDESDLFESGEVDALFHAAEPRAHMEGHPKVARLFSGSEDFFVTIARPQRKVRPGGIDLEHAGQASRASSPNALRFFSMCPMSMRDAFCGSGSTAKVAPTTSSSPSVKSLTTFILPVTGGMGPRWVKTPEATK